MNTLRVFAEDDMRDHPLEHLGLDMRTFNALRRAEVMTVGDVLKYSGVALLARVRNFGPASLADLESRLQTHGLYLFDVPQEEREGSGVGAMVACSHEWHSAGYRPVDDALVLYCRHCGCCRAYGVDGITR